MNRPQSFYAAVALLAWPLLAGFAAPGADRYQPVRIHETTRPIFPFQATNLGLNAGEARVIVDIDASGRLADWLVTAYSHPSFAASAVSALRHWTFEPALLDGHPVAVTKEFGFNFTQNGITVINHSASENIDERMQAIDPQGNAYRTYTLGEIDRIPVPTHVVRPEYPEGLWARGVKGTVVLDYYVDESGRVRMPMVTNNAPPELAALAADAVQKWQYEAPTHRGRAVMIRVRQEFRFKDGAGL